MVSPLFLTVGIADMVLRAGPVAKAVMICLLCFSLFSWTLIMAKGSQFSKARKQSDRFLYAFRKGPRAFEISVLDQYQASPLVALYERGLGELSHQAGGGGKITNPEAIQRAIQMASGDQMMRLENKLPWLATTASVTPFIGLFGTVWGIMDAFQGLASGGASIRVVAPGIAEALITTAAGLFAAIPAVIFYNVFLNSLRAFGSRMDNFALEFQNLAERHYK
jgi:biopolymer transport protein TolQ